MESVGNVIFVPRKEVCCRAHGEMSSSAATAEKRERKKETRGERQWITAAHALLCWSTAASALGHVHSPRLETRRHD